MTAPRALISDFGGVMTAPLLEAFAEANERIGIGNEQLGQAMVLFSTEVAEPPLFALERGQLSERDFLGGLARALTLVTQRPVELDGYGRMLMEALHPNERLIAYYRSLHERGVRLAILTNNVREWQPIWRERLGADDALFELVVDSGFEGVRKPEPEIYALTLERLGLSGDDCVFVDDLEINLPPARDAGMAAVHFRDTDQAIGELDALFDGARFGR
jgi:putative hydrolase of the HAD superfamily